MTQEQSHVMREEGMNMVRSRGKTLDWRDTIQIGDVIKTKTGYRVVRDATYFPEDDRYGRGGMLSMIVFAIKRKSWTQRAYTHYCRSAIKDWEKVPGVRVKLNTEADKKLLDDIRGFKAPKNYKPDSLGNPFIRRIQPATCDVDNYDYLDAMMFP